MKPILIIADIFKGRVRQVTWELAGAARKIAVGLSQKQNSPESHVPNIYIIVPSDNPTVLAEEISMETGMDVLGVENLELKTYTSEIYIACLGQVIRKMNPSHILAAHTSQGRDFAPGLSIELDAASIPCVNGIRSDENGLVYSRPVFDNTKNMLVCPDPDKPVVLTIMPGVFKPDIHAGNPGHVDIQNIPFDPASRDKWQIQHQQVLKRPGENQALKAAKVIVAAGRGIGPKENLKLVFKLAECFSASAVGASRPLVDMGWIGYGHQVGITGASVAPDLYIACGISGSSQHIAGMKDAKFVISINKNPGAPIFRHSDLCITEDVIEFIHAFLKTKTCLRL
ncbi:MAG: electron transfer flavoprotein subunit alpha/FixB family protein [Desulfobacula sp.]|jgi:electron transfer flavoprotein alpha subunit|nr:electron transfer flavoprotein subunit alpha/FixB family protein [Desulfobacula sp.]